MLAVDREEGIMSLPVLTMTLKREWFDKILSGEKSIEYRVAKEYWRARLEAYPGHPTPNVIRFRNGYSASAPSFMADVIWVDLQNGKNTDLKYDGLVYAIKLGEPFAVRP